MPRKKTLNFTMNKGVNLCKILCYHIRGHHQIDLSCGKKDSYEVNVNVY